MICVICVHFDKVGKSVPRGRGLQTDTGHKGSRSGTPLKNHRACGAGMFEPTAAQHLGTSVSALDPSLRVLLLLLLLYYYTIIVIIVVENSKRLILCTSAGLDH